ncbi:MAG: serine/threonine-protein kinase [Deltaproteobacteria bacterium]|nr:serine/threonine-protein kinase [Deltaproteobacteria bacterium]
MDDDLWQRADKILSAALDLPPESRTAFVQQAAPGDGELGTLVRRLLKHSQESEEELVPGLGLPVAPALGLPAPEAEESVSVPGTVVGRYRLLGELGRGGMAVVYRAERIDGDFEHQVALKQLHRAHSEELARRLEQERQILARATHPDLARLLDGGVDAAGRPYLVMELVDGIPIDQYCDRHRLGVSARLALFLRIARAVQYAHRNLVIHRDIKPSNILVTADGHPKLLDFGIARLLTEASEGSSLALTATGLRPMTPAYASPEQVRSEPVTTLSDIYQLGLLLYLLLSGRTPYREASSRSPLNLAQAISEQPPTHPTRALLDPPEEDSGSSETTAEAIAHLRGTTPVRLARQLDGDLGFIVLMALRKEPERRYSSVELMAADLERYLSGRTVVARPDSFWYRSSTFCRRHRIAVLLAGLLAIALMVFSVVSNVQSRRLASERDRANREAEISGEVSGFLSNLFRVSDPSEARGNSITAREILDRGIEDIDLRMPEPSLARARLKGTMGSVYQNLGLYQEALPLFESALATAITVAGVGSPEAASAQANLARLLMDLGRYEESEALIRSSLSQARDSLGEEHPGSLLLANSLAAVRHLQGDPEEAEATSRKVLEARRRILGPRHPETLRVANSQASILFGLGRLEEAEALYRQVLEGFEKSLGADHPATLKVASNLGSVWVQLGKFDEAEPLLRSTIEQRRRVLGADHPGTLSAETNLAGLLADRGDLAPAEEMYRRVYERRLVNSGPEHPRTFDALYDLAWVLSLDPERQQQSAALYREVLVGYEKTRGPEHPYVPDTLYNLAVLEAKGGRPELALAYLKDAVGAGYRSKALFHEPAFEPLAEQPEMQDLLEVVRERREAR